MMGRLLRPEITLILLIASTLLSPPSTAQVRTLDLRDMVGSAGLIFVGRVTDVRGGSDEHGDIVTYTTFAIEQKIHGSAASTHTIKQLGGVARGFDTRIAHMHYFRQGDRVLVMLYPVSSIGFTSPIGLHQGVWGITPDGKIAGISDDALRGAASLLRRYGITLRETQSLDRNTFIGIIGDLLKEVGKR